MSIVVVPAFGQAVIANREAASHLAAARSLMTANSSAEPNAAHSHSAEIQRLDHKLAAQRDSLTRLSSQMQIAQPGFDGVRPSTVSDLADALSRANTSAQTADEQIAQVSKQVMPALFPTVTPIARASLVYIGCSFAFWLIQCGLLVATNGTDASALLLSLCGMPLLAFGVSYGMLELLGQPRVGPRYKYSPKFGALICFVGMPVAWILVILALSGLR